MFDKPTHNFKFNDAELLQTKNDYSILKIHATVAQLVEQQIRNL